MCECVSVSVCEHVCVMVSLSVCLCERVCVCGNGASSSAIHKQIIPCCSTLSSVVGAQASTCWSTPASWWCCEDHGPRSGDLSTWTSMVKKIVT